MTSIVADKCSRQEKWRKRLFEKYWSPTSEDKGNIKEWGRVFFNRRAKYEIACGGSKGVFVFDDNGEKIAISIQKIQKDWKKRMVEWKRNQQIEEKLDILKKVENGKYRKHFNFYEDQFEWAGFLFRKLTLCPKGTLSDLMSSDEYNLEQKLIKQLIVALNEAHRAGLVISDLKPENIMLCDCDCLAFIDMDSAIPLPYVDGSIYSTRWWNILNDPAGYVDFEAVHLLFKCSDWVAMSLIVMFHYAMRLRDPKGQSNIYKQVWLDWRDRDLKYHRIRNNITKKDFEECCKDKSKTPGLGDRLGPAAHAVLKSFSYEARRLPRILTIINLIKVSTQGSKETMFKDAFGLGDFTDFNDFGDLKLKL